MNDIPIWLDTYRQRQDHSVRTLSEVEQDFRQDMRDRFKSERGPGELHVRILHRLHALRLNHTASIRREREAKWSAGLYTPIIRCGS